MKYIGYYLGIMGVIIITLASIEGDSVMPILALVFFYWCYKSVFSPASASTEEYDPVDFASDDFDYR